MLPDLSSAHGLIPAVVTKVVNRLKITRYQIEPTKLAIVASLVVKDRAGEPQNVIEALAGYSSARHE